MNHNDGRVVVPAGSHEDAIAHLFPIVDLLIERGLQPVDEVMDHGFRPAPDGWRCPLLGVITPQDWEAVNDHFALPSSIAFMPWAWGGGGMIRDSANYVDIIGARDPLQPPNDGQEVQWARPSP